MITSDDIFYLHRARLESAYSADPSTKTGAVIACKYRGILATGFNQFAKGVRQLPERLEDRDIKYPLTVHCEVDALIKSRYEHIVTSTATLYTWPFMSCSRCMAIMLHAGIRRFVAPEVDLNNAKEKALHNRWSSEMKLAKMQADDAGATITLVPKSRLKNSP